MQWILFLAQRPSADLLVFKNGDELPGKALSATLQGPVRWRTTHGQELEFQPGRVAGVRLSGIDGDHAARAAEAAAMVELRTGERLRGKLLTLDEKQVRLEHAQLGVIALDPRQVWHLFPNAQRGPIDGGRGPGGWKWASPESPWPSEEPPNADGRHWVYLDGTYLLRGAGTTPNIPTSTLPGWQHPVEPGLDRFEVRLEMASAGRFPASCALTLFGHSGIALCAIVSYRDLAVTVVDTGERSVNKWRQFPLSRIQNANGARGFSLLTARSPFSFRTSGSARGTANGHCARRPLGPPP